MARSGGYLSEDSLRLVLDRAADRAGLAHSAAELIRIGLNAISRIDGAAVLGTIARRYVDRVLDS